jgi:hypothetical protein
MTKDYYLDSLEASARYAIDLVKSDNLKPGFLDELEAKMNFSSKKIIEGFVKYCSLFKSFDGANYQNYTLASFKGTIYDPEDSTNIIDLRFKSDIKNYSACSKNNEALIKSYLDQLKTCGASCQEL